MIKHLTLEFEKTESDFEISVIECSYRFQKYIKSKVHSQLWQCFLLHNVDFPLFLIFKNLSGVKMSLQTMDASEKRYQMPFSFWC